MARNDGPIQFKGSIGNIRSYYDRDLKKQILMTTGGINKNLIENNPTFARTRDCMNECTSHTKWVSMLRRCLLIIGQLMFSRYFPQIVKLGKEIEVRDMKSTFGFRSIKSSSVSYLFRKLNFNRLFYFQGVIRDAYVGDGRLCLNRILNNNTKLLYFHNVMCSYRLLYMTLLHFNNYICTIICSDLS